MAHLFGVTGTSTDGWIAGDDRAVWVTDSMHDQLLRIDPRTNTLAATIPTGPAPAGVAIGADAVWVANHHGRSLSKVDPLTNRLVTTVPVGDQAAPANLGPQSLAYAEGVWFVAADKDTFWVERLDSATGYITAQIEVMQPCGELIAEGAAVWAARSGCATGNPIARFRQGGIDRTVSGVGPPLGGVMAFGALWVVAPGKLLDIKPGEAALVAGVQVGTRDGNGIAATPDALWVSTPRGLYRLLPDAGARGKAASPRAAHNRPARRATRSRATR